MASGLSGCLLNIVLDWVFIFPMNTGVAGAAIAATIGNVVSFLIVFRCLFRTRSFGLKSAEPSDLPDYLNDAVLYLFSNPEHAPL